MANVAIAFAIFVANILPGLWPRVSGRDFFPQSFVASLLILSFSFILRFKFKWPASHSLCSLIPLQGIILILVSNFTGYEISEILVNLDLLFWLLIPNIFISLPWIAGTFGGGYLLKRKNQMPN